MEFYRLESILTELFNDNIDVNSVDKRGDVYMAFIDFDGIDFKGYSGTVEFKCFIEPSGNIVDFELINYTGCGYINKPEID